MLNPKMQIIWQVLDMAKDVEDTMVINACRRLIEANRKGWKKYARKSDINLVMYFAEAI